MLYVYLSMACVRIFENNFSDMLLSTDIFIDSLKKDNALQLFISINFTHNLTPPDA